MDKVQIADWLHRYVDAWKSYDPKVIADLFAEDARYFLGPFAKPYEGREAIIAAWLESPDKAGTYDASYEPVALDGDTAVTSGRTVYFKENSTEIDSEWSNVFILRFDGQGRCREYREWFVRNPKKG